MKADRFELATKHLGFPGRMLSGSKSGYMTRFPKSRPFFNANVFAGDTAEKLWHGDVDLGLPKDVAALKALAAELGCPVYATSESPFRFDPPKDAAELDRACGGEYPRAVRFDP